MTLTIRPDRPTRPLSPMPEHLRQFKDAQRSMWALGDYPQISHDLLGPLGDRLVSAAHIRAGQHVLDVASGSGNVALRAAATGAHVIASDLTPALFEDGEIEATARGVEVDWVEADAEDLPFDDAMFDSVVSCVGAMFAPRHQRAADEMARVCRPGGTLALASWTPQGTIGAFIEVFQPYLPAPEPEFLPPTLWGDPEHVRALFGDRVQWQQMSRETLRVDHFAGPEHFCAYYKGNFGPTMRAYAEVADDPERCAALDRDFYAFAEQHARYGPGGVVHYEFEYLLSVGTLR
jgi:SAM-dependent methyltransferase